MKVNILYDEYNTKIEKATILFGELPETEQSIELEVFQENIGEDEVDVFIDKVRLKSTDSNNIEISNEMDKNDLRTFMSVIRNVVAQMK